ncbi:MAG: amidohydrolase family protein [Chloroflexota bacterium]
MSNPALKIDIHAHLYPEEYLRRVEALFAHPKTPEARATRILIDTKIRKDPAMWTVDHRLELMEKLGVDYQVLSLSIPQAYEGDAGTRRDLARLANDFFAEQVERHPNRFLAFASLPLPDIEGSLRELARCVDGLGMVGVCLGSHVNGRRYDDPLFTPLFDEIDRRGLPVFLHPMIAECSANLEDYNLNATLGFIMDTGMTVLRMVFGGMFEKYRRFKLVVPHLGGMLPYLFGRIEGAYRSHPACKAIPRSPIEYMKEFYYDLVSYHVPSIHMATDLFGADHLLLGSDYPFGLGDVHMAIQSIYDAGFSEADQAKIFGENARKLLGRP